MPLVGRARRGGSRRAGGLLPGAAHVLARQALQMPFHCGGFFSLTLLGRLLVEFTASQLGEDPRLFTGTLEATQGGVKIFIFTNANAGHSNLNWWHGR